MISHETNDNNAPLPNTSSQNDPARNTLLGGARVTALWTMLSRILGMLRDMATASLLGLSAGGAMDAFALAFRIPNLFRRLFGEGALTAAYIPVLTARLHDPDHTRDANRRSAWELASTVAFLLGIVLAIVVLLGELGCWALLTWYGDHERIVLVARLLAVMMPYVLLICLTAQISATLHALNRFALPAIVPVLLNLCWLAAALLVAPRFAPDANQQAMTLAVAVLIAGVLQLGVQIPALRREGFRFRYHWQSARDGVRQIVGMMAPMTVGLMITQINTLVDSLIAWCLSAVPETISTGLPQRINWLSELLGGVLGHDVYYPMQQGATAAVYFGTRLYQLPLGILGIAVATAIFPLLSRHAIRGDRAALGNDLTLGLRLVTCLSVPASVGLVLMARPIATLLFERGSFTPEDTLRTARMIAGYGLGVWAFCALPVVVRGYYALKDTVTPVRIGALAACVNLLLSLTLIWPLGNWGFGTWGQGELGLALSTSIAAIVQLVMLLAMLSRHGATIQQRDWMRTIARTLIASAMMWLVGQMLLAWLTTGSEGSAPADTLLLRLVTVTLPIAACIVVYLIVYRLLGGREIGMLLRGREANTMPTSV